MPCLQQSLTGSLIVLACLLLVAPGQAQNTSIQSCPGNGTQTCMGGQWFNTTTCTCRTCRVCQGPNVLTEFECNATHDTVCGCNSPLLFLDSSDGVCRIRCKQCPGGMCRSDSFQRCLCRNPECYLSDDALCERPLLCQQTFPITMTSRPRQNPPNPFSNDDSLPPWGIGLIAVGIVIGIIVFASCFLCLGIFTQRKNSDPESHPGSDTSENGLVPHEAFSSINTNSSYLSSNSMYPYLSTHSMLQLLKNSNPQLVIPGSKPSGSSLQGSPLSSVRGSPTLKPGRTVKLAKCANSDKLTAIVL